MDVLKNTPCHLDETTWLIIVSLGLQLQTIVGKRIICGTSLESGSSAYFDS